MELQSRFKKQEKGNQFRFDFLILHNQIKNECHLETNNFGLQ